MKHALICGVTGQDGALLAQLLLKKGYRVTGMTRDLTCPSRNLLALGLGGQVEMVSFCLTDTETVIRALDEIRPDEIYHLAGQSAVGKSFDCPVATFESIAVTTLNLLEAVRVLKLPARVFNAGSGDCFGNTHGAPVDEQTPFSPISPYGVAKTAACHTTRIYRESYHLFACTGILFNHESWLRPETFVTQKIVRTACDIAQGRCNRLAVGNVEIERDWGWAPEYVTAMWQMLQQSVPEDYIIATGRSISLKTFIGAVFQRLGLNWADYVEMDARFLRASDIHTVRANPAKARTTLNWAARFNAEDVAAMMVDAQLNSERTNTQ